MVTCRYCSESLYNEKNENDKYVPTEVSTREPMIVLNDKISMKTEMVTVLKRAAQAVAAVTMVHPLPLIMTEKKPYAIITISELSLILM